MVGRRCHWCPAPAAFLCWIARQVALVPLCSNCSDLWVALTRPVYADETIEYKVAVLNRISPMRGRHR